MQLMCPKDDQQLQLQNYMNAGKSVAVFLNFLTQNLQISAKFRAHFVHKAKLQNLRMKVDSVLIFQNQHAIKSTVK